MASQCPQLSATLELWTVDESNTERRCKPDEDSDMCVSERDRDCLVGF